MIIKIRKHNFQVQSPFQEKGCTDAVLEEAKKNALWEICIIL
jgi:hypothetical protein